MIFENLFKNKHYFFVVEVDRIAEQGKTLDEKMLKEIKKYLWLRRREPVFIEAYSSQTEAKAFLIIGTSLGKENKDRIVRALLLELYASLREPTLFKVTDDFPMIEKTFNKTKVKQYTINI